VASRNERPERSQLRSIKRPGVAGRGDRMRPGFPGRDDAALSPAQTRNRALCWARAAAFIGARRPPSIR
jgi:hypothetical protein